MSATFPSVWKRINFKLWISNSIYTLCLLIFLLYEKGADPCYMFPMSYELWYKIRVSVGWSLDFPLYK
jgi:hypothetical protein